MTRSLLKHINLHSVSVRNTAGCLKSTWHRGLHNPVLWRPQMSCRETALTVLSSVTRQDTNRVLDSWRTKVTLVKCFGGKWIRHKVPDRRKSLFHCCRLCRNIGKEKRLVNNMETKPMKIAASLWSCLWLTCCVCVCFSSLIVWMTHVQERAGKTSSQYCSIAALLFVSLISYICWPGIWETQTSVFLRSLTRLSKHVCMHTRLHTHLFPASFFKFRTCTLCKCLGASHL